MNEDAALEQLRDIHLPSDLGVATTLQFATWPFVVLALVVSCVLAARLWNRNRWRRKAKAELSQILAVEDRASQWAMLLTFAVGLSARTGRALTLPGCTFVRPDNLTDAQRAELISFLGVELRR